MRKKRKFKKSSSSEPLAGSIPTKLDTKHPWVKGIQVCPNEGPHPFPIRDYAAILQKWFLL